MFTEKHFGWLKKQYFVIQSLFLAPLMQLVIFSWNNLLDFTFQKLLFYYLQLDLISLCLSL